MNKSNIVKLTLNLANPPTPTNEQKARLAALSALPDNQIDTSRPDAIWAKAADIPHGKKLVSLRLDEDILDFFRHTGKPASMPSFVPI